MDKDFWDKLTKNIKTDNFTVGLHEDGKSIMSSIVRAFVAQEMNELAIRLKTLQKILRQDDNMLMGSLITCELIDSSKNFDEALFKLEKFKNDVRYQIISLDKFNNDKKYNVHKINEERYAICRHTGKITKQKFDGTSIDSEDEHGWSCIHEVKE